MVRRRKPVFVDLFAGCGGLSLGLELAGFRPILFSELNPSAADTYLANREGLGLTNLRDISRVDNSELDSFVQKCHQEQIGEIDLVCGGPPCQGYSGIGHRRSYKVEKAEIPSNKLYLHMIRVIERLKPRMFLFENVRGIMFGRWTAEGEKGQIWTDVQNAFKEQLASYYVPNGELLHAGSYDVPQNRPRVFIVGIRKDIVKFPFSVDVGAQRAGLLPARSAKTPNIEDVLEDLVDRQYLKKASTTRYPRDPQNELQEEYRRDPSGRVLMRGELVTEHEYSSHSPEVVEKFKFMILHPDEPLPEAWRTKKFAQRVLPRKWNGAGPNITVCSLPDDYIHYMQPRILTVREWARLQTFPDWYQFKGPRTTGGHRRAGIPTLGIWDRDVPKYTQIGNAVPVKLAYNIGKHFLSLF